MKSFLTGIILLVFLLTLIITNPVAAATEQRIALVIGNSAYSSGPLKNPVNDATDMAATLKRLGFSVIIKKNANQRVMEESIQEFGNKLKRGGVGLFYYAGHGLQVNGVNYLIPIAAKINQESDVKYEAIDANKVLDEMANANNGLNIVILDACRDNPFTRSFRNSTRGLAIVSSAPAGTFLSYSTGPGSVASDGKGRNSPYAEALSKYMKEPGLSIEQVFKKVRARLGKETGNRQIPWELSSLQGEFYFVPDSSKTATDVSTSGQAAIVIDKEDSKTSAPDEMDNEQRKIEEERQKLQNEEKLIEQKTALVKEKRRLEEKRKSLEKESQALELDKSIASLPPGAKGFILGGKWTGIDSDDNRRSTLQIAQDGKCILTFIDKPCFQEGVINMNGNDISFYQAENTCNSSFKDSAVRYELISNYGNVFTWKMAGSQYTTTFTRSVSDNRTY